jgi:DsbC/DsbD-like thiol-disulfide interchange protein
MALAAVAALGCLYLGVGPARVAAQGSGDKSSHVKVSVTAEKPDADGKQVISVTLEMEPGWHIYANPTEHEFFEKEATKVKASIDGKPVDVKVDYPKGKVIEDKVIGNFRVYSKAVTLKGTVQRPKGDNHPLKVKVGFQQCNEKGGCLPHVDVEREVP